MEGYEVLIYQLLGGLSIYDISDSA